MGTDEQPFSARKHEHEEEEEEVADGDAAPVGRETLARGRVRGRLVAGPRQLHGRGGGRGGANREHANGGPREEEVDDGGDEEENEEEEEEEEEDRRRLRLIELRRDCPYLDTVNRQLSTPEDAKEQQRFIGASSADKSDDPDAHLASKFNK